jgi:hypothetical protein
MKERRMEEEGGRIEAESGTQFEDRGEKLIETEGEE